jgi:hypothetical protein
MASWRSSIWKMSKNFRSLSHGKKQACCSKTTTMLWDKLGKMEPHSWNAKKSLKVTWSRVTYIKSPQSNQRKRCILHSVVSCYWLNTYQHRLGLFLMLLREMFMQCHSILTSNQDQTVFKICLKSYFGWESINMFSLQMTLKCFFKSN